MSASGNASCPRCGGAFHCGAALALTHPTPCACSSVTLSPDTTRQLRERYSSCLCLRCLAELGQHPADEKKPAEP